MILVTVAGNLGRDAEMRDTSAGPVLSFSVASTSRRGADKTTTWVRCSMFGRRGEALRAHLTSGTRVTVTGTGALRSYTTRDGEQRTELDVTVSELALQGGGERRQTREPGDDRDEDPFG